jgi:hypothetical protein
MPSQSTFSSRLGSARTNRKRRPQASSVGEGTCLLELNGGDGKPPLPDRQYKVHCMGRDAQDERKNMQDEELSSLLGQMAEIETGSTGCARRYTGRFRSMMRGLPR